MSGPEGSQPSGPQWWQQVKRQTPPPPSYRAEPPGPPPPRPAYQPAQQPAPHGQYYPQHAQQPGQYGYPAAYGAQPAASAAVPHQSNRWLLITGGVLLGTIVAVALVLGLWGFGAFNRQVLDVNKAQDAVKRVITDPATGYGLDNVTDVNCNNGNNPAAKKGDTFTCQVTVDGKKRQVTAVFVDDNGTYEVDRPR